MRFGHAGRNGLLFVRVCLIIFFGTTICNYSALIVTSSNHSISNQTPILPTAAYPGSPIDSITTIFTNQSTALSTTSVSKSPFNTGDYDQMQKYVTPDDQIIKEMLPNILRNKEGFNDNNALRNWVASNIVYDSAKAGDTYGIAWQFPVETLTLGTGVCIDYSTLLCSLLRANNVPSDQVYIAIAYKKNQPQTPMTVHAFLVVKYYTGFWTVIEPQRNAAAGQSYADRNDFLTFDIVYYFNDKGYHKGSPSMYTTD